MNLKLFTVMGISWVLEIISTFNTNKTMEVVLDLYNIFLGVFIFFIFVFKRKVLYELQSRFGNNCYEKFIKLKNENLFHLLFFPKIIGLKPRNTGTVTPRTTTLTHTSNISMKDLTSTIEKNTLLLSASTTNLQVPSFRK